MEITLSMLADCANMAGNKLNMLGVFTKIPAPAVPHKQATMSIVFRMTASPGEKGTEHKVKILVVDDDGKPIAPPIEMNIGVPNIPGPDVEFNVILGMNGILFRKYGTYRIDVTIDGQSKNQTIFSVVPSVLQPQLPLPPTPP